MSAHSGTGVERRSILLVATLVLLTAEVLMDASSTVLKLSGKHIPLPVVVASLVAAVVVATGVAGLFRHRSSARTLAAAGSALSSVIGLVGVFAAPNAATKSGNGVLFLLGLGLFVVLTRSTQKTLM